MVCTFRIFNRKCHCWLLHVHCSFKIFHISIDAIITVRCWVKYYEIFMTRIKQNKNELVCVCDRLLVRALVGTWYIIQIFAAFFILLKTTVLFTVFAVKPLSVQVYNEHFYSRIKLSMEIFVIIFRLDTICDHFKRPLSRILSIHRLHATFFRMQ